MEEYIKQTKEKPATEGIFYFDLCPAALNILHVLYILIHAEDDSIVSVEDANLSDNFVTEIEEYLKDQEELPSIEGIRFLCACDQLQ